MMPMSQTSDITAEKTPNYMSAPMVPERIHEMFPNISLIFVLCEPGQRAFSDYKYLMRTKVSTYLFCYNSVFMSLVTPYTVPYFKNC